MRVPLPLFLIGIALAASLSDPLSANVVPNALFDNNAVLQQEMKVPVWGSASEGEKVTVSFGSQKVETVTRDGKWMVWLEPMKANAAPQTMTISSATNSLSLTNILIGEVWVCSGQSNMERQLGLRKGQKPIENYQAEAASANYPTFRHFLVQHTKSHDPVNSLSGSWSFCSPATVTNFTAVGYYFGRDLTRALKVPVGLIHSSWGGTPAEAWTRHEALSSNPVLVPILQVFSNNIETFKDRLAKFRMDEPVLLAAYTNSCAQAKADGMPNPKAPSPPTDPLTSPSSPSVLFNAMINPLIPYAIRGVIWYQGESNQNQAKLYQDLFPAMIEDWRGVWGEGNFPFLFVQVAPFEKMNPEIREAQLQSLKKTTNTAMAVTTDVGDAHDIHPAHKEPVGDRLALAARALAYGEKIEYMGPIFREAKTNGQSITLSFDHTGGGLVAKDGPLRGFEIAGADKVFVPAQAEIKEGVIVVTSPQATNPVAVHYGWTNVPNVNLFNKEGLPASPFRTDPE